MRRQRRECGGVFDLVTRHKDYDPKLHSRVLMQDKRRVENCATREAKKMYRMQRAVMWSLHAKKGFLRLNMSEKGVLYAKTRLEHNVLDLLLKHFHNRFPGFHIAIETGGKTGVIGPGGWIDTYPFSVEEAVKRLESRGPENQTVKSLENGDRKKLWSEYYESQKIDERRNISLMKKMMPLKHRDKDAHETTAGCKNITDYLN